jgi:hypothetical protein
MSASLLLESIRPIIRTMHYSIQTEKAYLHWLKISFCLMTNAMLKILGKKI